MNITKIIIDVDGTLTNGIITVDSKNIESLNFSVYDGNAIVNLPNFTDRIYIISGRKSRASFYRMKKLGLKNIYLGIEKKLNFVKTLISEVDLKTNTLVIGDDFPDLELFFYCKYKACPANAVKEIKSLSDFVSSLNGGNGAIREIFDHFNLFKKNQ